MFGQTTIRPEMFEDKLALTLGLRYTEEKKDIKYLYRDAGSVLLPGPVRDAAHQPGLYRRVAAHGRPI